MQLTLPPCPDSKTVTTSALSASAGEQTLCLGNFRAAIRAAHRWNERDAVRWLLAQMQSNPEIDVQSQELARRLVQKVRDERSSASGVAALMHEFTLSSEEGVALMCLAEALLRIPDDKTIDRLIVDKTQKPHTVFQVQRSNLHTKF